MGRNSAAVSRTLTRTTDGLPPSVEVLFPGAEPVVALVGPGLPDDPDPSGVECFGELSRRSSDCFLELPQKPRDDFGDLELEPLDRKSVV